jgi:hypothetical protein
VLSMRKMAGAEALDSETARASSQMLARLHNAARRFCSTVLMTPGLVNVLYVVQSPLLTIPAFI